MFHYIFLHSSQTIQEQNPLVIGHSIQILFVWKGHVNHQWMTSNSQENNAG